MALPKRIIKETERLMAEPWVQGSRCLGDGLMARTVFRASVLCHMKTTYVTSMLAYMAHLSLRGIFKLELFLPDDYPMTPPKIRFLTKIYHPNIDKLGRICLDVLKSWATPCAGMGGG
ncbi:hypothetical protein DV736_g476, partial [Chaetothyriales sp. CBS 134916]